ncbi:Ribonucleotide reductase large subunit [Lasiodiplodia theobromae]|uniref:Ribonucleotide reductase large subunit n=1 Tax=Lasiodiplodia theobromae TaxID=45133 RepID=UPI0015C3C5C6|nr:Ribonucleotide reductase large subunit [Lasiodiplodia theobromae]KAF4539608.1 Ribonucleotide reductase large subunit [Lasiodiplodia theobromae]
MYVIKRDGRSERFSLHKLDGCISKFTFGLHHQYVQAGAVSRRVADSLQNDIHSSELSDLAAETAASLVGAHPDYGILAARISISSLHKQTKKRFSSVISDLYHNKPAPLVSEEVFRNVQLHAEDLDSAIVHGRDEEYDYFTFEELVKPRLLPGERPQHMLMRTAVSVHGSDVAGAIQTYAAMSKGHFLLPLPSQLLPSFALDIADDSVDGIFSTLKTCAQTLARGGGSDVGLSVSRVRANGSHIAGTDGTAKGVVPMLRVFNDTARLAGRERSLAVYLEPWHADVFDFLNLGRSFGKEELRARDLRYALWVPDLFMRRVHADLDWTLMCPAECLGLADCYGAEFDELYERYESEGCGRRTVKARELWTAIVEAQLDTGGPSVLYKDACNRKSNQQHLGPVRGSGLRSELMLSAAPGVASSCAQAALHLPAFVSSAAEFDFDGLHHATQLLTRSLDRMLDDDAVPEAIQRDRPLGVGAFGLADTFIALGLPYDSAPARHLNVRIFETIYHAALTASTRLAQAAGTPHASYAGSPVASGCLQYDLWDDATTVVPTEQWDWNQLKADIAAYGVRNAVLVALPCGSSESSSSSSLGSAPSHVRLLRGGRYHAFSRPLVRALAAQGLWTADVRARIIADGGSVRELEGLPSSMKQLYATAGEMGQRAVLQLAADRAPFVDQSQTVDVAMPHATSAKVAAMHFFGWRAGLKTGCSGLRGGGAERLVPEAQEVARAVREVMEGVEMRGGGGGGGRKKTVAERGAAVRAGRRADESTAAAARGTYAVLMSHSISTAVV